MRKAPNLDGMGLFTPPVQRAPPEIKAELARGRDWGAMGKPNHLYMNDLLNAVEGGYIARWRRAPVTQEEIAAAYRATGRKPAPQREPGQDDEERDA